MAVIVTDNKLCYSVYEPENKILHSTYKGVLNREQFLIHHKNGIQFGQGHEIVGSLVDLRKLHGSYLKFFNFLEFEAYPGIQKAGFHCLAFVISDDIIIKNVTHKLMAVIERLALEAKIFTEATEARKWLLKCIKNGHEFNNLN
jgi:hypothetical protein